MYMCTFLKTTIISIVFFFMLSPLALTDNFVSIKSFNSSISITTNNLYIVSEKIEAYFDKPSKGIEKRIPLRYYNYDHEVSNITVTDEHGNPYVYTTTIKNNEMVIDIGIQDYPISGNRTYILKYTYNMGQDPYTYKDEINWLIVNDNWNCTIPNVSFKIEMPDYFDTSKIVFNINSQTESYNSNVFWDVNDNIITGKIITNLAPHEALSLYIPLKPGYFYNTSERPTNTFPYLLLVAAIILLFSAIVTFAIYKYTLYKIEKKPSVTPPTSLNCVEFKYLCSGFLGFHDIPTLLIEWANKGLVQIEKKIKIKMFKTKKYEFILTRLSDISSENGYEINLFNSLFPIVTTDNSNVIKSKTSFFKYCYYIIKLIKEKINNAFKPFDSYFMYYINALRIASFFLLVIVITSFLHVLTSDIIISALVGVLLGLIIHWLCFYFLEHYNFTIQNLKTGIFSICCIKVFSVITILLLSLYIIGLSIFNSIVISKSILGSDISGKLFIGYILVYPIISMLTSKAFKYKKPIYEAAGDVLGFYDYLTKISQEQIDTATKENSNYFFNILPYAINLGFSGTWYDKFKDVVNSPPFWYPNSTDESGFDIKNFVYEMLELVNNSTHLSIYEIENKNPEPEQDSNDKNNKGTD